MKFLRHLAFAAVLAWLAAGVVSVSHAQVYNKFGPSTGVLKGSTTTYQTTAAGIADFQTVLSTSPGLVLGGATGGTKGAGTINAAGLYVNGSAVGVGGGAVSSVGLSAPTCFGVTGSPVTSSGTLGLTLSGTTSQYIDGTGACQTTAIGANPTGTIGLTAVNGTATTFTRSDGAPALSQAIVPTWTGTHLFEGAPSVATGSSATTLGVSSGAPVINFINSTGATNAHIWRQFADSTSFHLQTLNDANTIGDDILTATRSGVAGTAITLGNSTDKPPITLNGPVTIPAPSSGAAVSVSGAPAASLGGSAVVITGSGTTGQSRGLFIAAGTNSSDAPIQVQNQAQNANYLIVSGNGAFQAGPAGNFIISSAGNETLAAPSSGTALNISGAANANVLFMQASGTSGQSFGLQIEAGTTAADRSLLVQNQAGNTNYLLVRGDGTGTLGINATNTLSWNSSGNYTIAAPVSSHALSLAAANGSEALVITTPTSAGQSFGAIIEAGTNSSDYALRITSATAATEYLRVYGDGGVTVGLPTGGDKGVGTVNMTGCFVNNQPCLTTTSGGASKFASGVFTTAASSCTINFNGGGIASCAYNSAGNVTVSFTASYFGTGATCVADGNNGANLLATGPGTPITSSANITLRTSSGTFTDGIFSLVCAGT